MNEENKRRCRKEIELRNWNKLGIIEESPSCLLWNKEVELMYEDMDGQPCTCKAIYVHESFSPYYFKATSGMAKGNRMSGCIAYREIKED